MRVLLLLTGFSLLAAPGLPQSGAGQEGAAAAARAYDTGDYETAAVIYRDLIEAGGDATDRAALHYNLGNAEYRSGRLGYAMLHWERSLALNPGDEDARVNVALARRVLDRRLTDAAAAGDPDTFLLELLRSMQGFHVWLRQTPPGRFAWALSICALLVGTFWTLLMLRWGRRLLVLAGFGLALLATTSSGILLRLRITAPLVAVVVQPGAALRSGPGHSFPQLAALPEGLYLELDDAGPASEEGFRRYVAAGIVGYADEATVIPVAER